MQHRNIRFSLWQFSGEDRKMRLCAVMVFSVIFKYRFQFCF